MISRVPVLVRWHCIASKRATRVRALRDLNPQMRNLRLMCDGAAYKRQTLGLAGRRLADNALVRTTLS